MINSANDAAVFAMARMTAELVLSIREHSNSRNLLQNLANAYNGLDSLQHSTNSTNSTNSVNSAKSEQSGFNKLFCSICNKITYHYKPTARPAHCTIPHSAWPNETALIAFKAKGSIMIPENNIEQSQNNTEVHDAVTQSEQAKLPTFDLAITRKQQYHVAEVHALDAIKGSAFERFQIVEARIKNYREVLFANNTALECASQRLMELRALLTNEEREKLGVKHVEYKPGSLNAANVKPPKARMSSEDKKVLKSAEIIFSPQLMRGNRLASQLFKEHPEYYSNGALLSRHKKTVEEYYAQNNAMTEEMAVATYKEYMATAKAKTIQKIISGEIGVDGRPLKKKDEEDAE